MYIGRESDRTWNEKNYSEFIQSATKLLRFGETEDNIERVAEEAGDALLTIECVVDMLQLRDKVEYYQQKKMQFLLDLMKRG